MTSQDTIDIENHPLRIVRPRELRELLGVSTSTLRRLREKKNFPQPVELGTGRTGGIGFFLKDVEAWLLHLAHNKEAAKHD